MKFAKSTLMATGSVVLAGLILTLLAPKAVHAIVATAVQVMNTSATPVPNKDVDEPARNAFVATCDNASNPCTLNPAVPPGFTLVIQNINLYADLGATPYYALPMFRYFAPDGNWYSLWLSPSFSPDGRYLIAQSTPRIYVRGDGSNANRMMVSYAALYGPIPNVHVVVTGYLVSVP